jgi:signal transduction histidine kinase
MPEKHVQPEISLSEERRKRDRRKTLRRVDDQRREQLLNDRDRKLQSLLELGQLIGLDLKIDGLLLQIAEKASEVMEADRCSLFLYDSITDELWSTVAMGMEGEVIRIPSRTGLAGACFHIGETINLKDAYKDERFNKAVDLHTGYRTRSLLCMPLRNRAGDVLGVIQLLNKKGGVFTDEDETFLRTFGNHASVFIEMAQLQKARIEVLEESREELRRLNRAKDKALNHLAHELRTPLALILGTLRLLRRKLQIAGYPKEWDRSFESMERHLNRLLSIQKEADDIIRSHQKLNHDLPQEALGSSVRSETQETVFLYPFVQKILASTREKAKHREVQILLEGKDDVSIVADPGIVEETLGGLLKNAIENTPDEGRIRVVLKEMRQNILLEVQDQGVGITDENQRYIFDGLFTTQETDLYSSRKPYEFGAGGKGLDLHRMKAYGQRFGFDLSVESRRCVHLPTDRDICPGRISQCSRCQNVEDCLNSGGSTFSLAFPAVKEERSEKSSS